MAETATAIATSHWSEEAFDSLCETLEEEDVALIKRSAEAQHRAFGDFKDRHGNPVTVTVTRLMSPEVRISVNFSRQGSIFAEVRAQNSQAWSWVDRGFPLPWNGLRSVSFALTLIGRYIRQLQSDLEH